MALATTAPCASRFTRFPPPQRPRARVPAAGGTDYDLTRTGDDRYRLALAVPGFAADDLVVEVEAAELVVRGTPAPGNDGAAVLHRGFVRRPFERRFALGEHVRVEDARLEHGLLRIDLVRDVPEALRPRTIAIDKAA